MTFPWQDPARSPNAAPCEVSFQISLLRLTYRDAVPSEPIVALEQLLQPAAAVSLPA